MPDNRDKTLPPDPVPFIAVIACTVGIYAAWFLLQILVHQAGRIIFRETPLLNVLIPLAVIFGVFVAAALTACYLIYAEPGLSRRPVWRTVLIAICLAIGTILFALTRKTETDIIIPVLSTANLLVLACLVGPWLTRALKRPAEIVLIASLVLMIDVISVLAGPTRVISAALSPYYMNGMTGPAPLSDILILKATVPGLTQAMPVFGVSDWIMLVFFAAACVKFDIRDNLLGEGLDTMVRKKAVSGPFLPVTGAGLITAVIAAKGLGIFLPALPFMALALILHLTIRFPETRRLERRDWLSAVIITMVAAAVAAFVFHFKAV